MKEVLVTNLPSDEKKNMLLCCGVWYVWFVVRLKDEKKIHEFWLIASGQADDR